MAGDTHKKQNKKTTTTNRIGGALNFLDKFAELLEHLRHEKVDLFAFDRLLLQAAHNGLRGHFTLHFVLHGALCRRNKVFFTYHS